VNLSSIMASGLVLTALFVAVLLLTIQKTKYDIWGGILVGPILFGLALPVLARQARRENDPGLFRLLVAGLSLRFVGALGRQIVAFVLYGGVADAAGYHGAGTLIAAQFRIGNFDVPLSPLTGTNFIKLFTGIVYTFTGPTLMGGYFFYAWMGFWGLFLFYRAFTIAVPEGRSRSYARLLCFVPSLVFWPSGLGKDAWLVFALGVMAFGGAKLLTGRARRGLAIACLGFVLGWLVRPHIVGMMGLALAFAYLIRRPNPRWRELAPVAKIASLVVVSVAAWFFVVQGLGFLEQSDINTSTGVTSALGEVARRTSQGGSEFAAPTVHSPAQLPLAAATVLFRPLPFEAHNVLTLVASMESTFMLAFCLARWRWIKAAALSVRRQPYVAAVLAYLLMFIVVFSATGNFGILTRQRDQLLPMFLVLLSVPPAIKATMRGASTEVTRERRGRSNS